MTFLYLSWTKSSWTTGPSKLVDSVGRNAWRRCRFIYPVVTDGLLGRTIKEEGLTSCATAHASPAVIVIEVDHED